MQNKTSNTSSSESSEIIEAHNRANEELTKIRRSLVIFNNKKTGFGSIISYHEGTVTPAFFPLEYKEQEREDIFNTINHEVDELIKKVEAVKLNSGNKKLDSMFTTRVKGTKEQLEGFKKLKYLEAEKLGYTFHTEEVREEYIKEAQEIVLHGRKQLHQQPKQVASMKSYLERILEKNVDKINTDEKALFEGFTQSLGKYTNQTKKKQKEIKPLPERNEIPQNLERVTHETQIYIMQLGLAFYEVENKDPSEENIARKIKIKESLKTIKETGLSIEEKTTILQESCEWKAVGTTLTNMKISARTKTVEIPIKESETTDRVCKLLNHEISRHILGHQNMENGTKKGVGEDSVPLEEGGAIFSELLRKYTLGEIMTHDLDPTEHHITVLMRELNNKSDTRPLIEIFFKLVGKENPEKQAIGRTNRVGRYGPDDRGRSYGKDHSYTEGQEELKAEILKLHNQGVELGDREELIRLVFSGKSDFKAIKKGHTKELLSLLGKSDLKEEFSSPILIGTILYDRLSGRGTKKDETINGLYDADITKQQKEILIHMEQAVRQDPISLANAA